MSSCGRYIQYSAIDKVASQQRKLIVKDENKLDSCTVARLRIFPFASFSLAAMATMRPQVDSHKVCVCAQDFRKWRIYMRGFRAAERDARTIKRSALLDKR